MTLFIHWILKPLISITLGTNPENDIRLLVSLRLCQEMRQLGAGSQ
jgi:hypothetical protein